MTDQPRTGGPKGGSNGVVRRRVVSLALAITMATTGASFAMNDPGSSSPAAAPARDPEFAVREEYDQAVRAGTVEALQLFIRRNPGHRLARRAARRVRAIEARAARRVMK